MSPLENEILIKILEVVNSVIGDTKITQTEIETDLIENDMDSLKFIRMIVALEEMFNIEMPDDCLVMSELNTVNKIFNIILSELKCAKEISQ